jgi:hypothetical protein
MWKFLAKTAAGVFLACVVGGIAIARHHGYDPKWKPIVIVAGLAVGFFILRVYFTVRKERDRLRRKQAIFVKAMQDLVDSMARLQWVDLSIFVTASQRAHQDEDSIAFLTGRGSANHHVLVQMVDLGMAKPQAMEQLGGSEFGIAQYALTPDGQGYLAELLDIVAKRRRFFGGLQAPA